MHNCHGLRVGWSTAFYKDPSNSYLKDVNNQRFNQSYHDTRSWYHMSAGSLASFKLTGSLFAGYNQIGVLELRSSVWDSVKRGCGQRTKQTIKTKKNRFKKYE